MARVHAALFPTRLALSRWQHGGQIPHLHHGGTSDTTCALRAAWYATARRDFQAWLDRGGFSQYEDAPHALPTPRLADCQALGEGGARQIGSCT